jgi:Lrp/AsnC family transcriptional regulator
MRRIDQFIISVVEGFFMHSELDGYDRRILALLQEDASLSSAQIAEQVGLSQSPCWRRIQRMKEEGIIRGQVTLLDRKKIGLNTQIFAQVKLNAHGRSNFTEFTEAIRGFPEVLECYVLMGAVDFMLRIVAADIEAYERFFFEKLSLVPGIQEVNSVVALSEIKSTTSLPV